MLPPVSLPMAKPTRPAAGGSAGPRAGARRPLLEQPRIHGLTAEPDVVQRQRAQAQLGHQHCARCIEPCCHGRVFLGYAIPVRLRAVGRRNPRRIKQVLRAPRNAVQRPAIMSCGNLCIGLPRLLERVLPRQRNHAVQLLVESLQAVEVNLRQPHGCDLPALNPARKLCHRCEGNVGIVAG